MGESGQGKQCRQGAARRSTAQHSVHFGRAAQHSAAQRSAARRSAPSAEVTIQSAMKLVASQSSAVFTTRAPRAAKLSRALRATDARSSAGGGRLYFN